MFGSPLYISGLLVKLFIECDFKIESTPSSSLCSIWVQESKCYLRLRCNGAVDMVDMSGGL